MGIALFAFGIIANWTAIGQIGWFIGGVMLIVFFVASFVQRVKHKKSEKDKTKKW